MSVFDTMANHYDRPERVEVAGHIADALRTKVAGCAKGIDYGCGTGLVGLRLAGCFEQLLLIDASPQMVEAVQQKIEASGLTNATALCADFGAEIPAGLAADCLFATQVLLHIPDTKRILAQFFAVLRPGGKLLIVDFDKNEAVYHEKVHNGFVQSELVALAEDVGFQAGAAETFYHGKNIFMNQDASLFLLEAEKPV